MSYCPVCNLNNSKNPDPKCSYCMGSGVIANNEYLKEQAEEAAYRNYEEEWRDRTS